MFVSVLLQQFSNGFSNLFPLWTLLVALTGVFKPSMLSGIPTAAFTNLLGLLMLSMGITLTVDDFKRVLTKPKIMAVGFAGCYVFMPLLALGLSKALSLSPALTAGMVLVGSINGGQASNLCTYIAKGDVALSVLMTTVTTVGAIFMTPLIAKLLLGALVPVDAVGVAISTVQVVLLPIVLGMLANYKFPKAVKKIEPFSPIVGVLSTCLLVGAAVAECSAPILAAGASLQAACAALHIFGGLASYFGLKRFFDEQTCRTVAIETSMKSSAFGFLLAKLHFSQFLVRVPAAGTIPNTPFSPHVATPISPMCQKSNSVLLDLIPSTPFSPHVAIPISPKCQTSNSVFFAKIPKTPFLHMWRTHFSHMSEIEF